MILRRFGCKPRPLRQADEDERGGDQHRAGNVGHAHRLAIDQPAAGSLIGWLRYDERMSLADIAGAVLIAAALVLIRLPERERPLASKAAQDHS